MDTNLGTAASPFLSPNAADLAGGGTRLNARTLARRARQRRQIQGMVGGSYAVDTAILVLYAYAGSIPYVIAEAYAACGLVLIAAVVMLSEAGVSERFRDHHLVAPQSMLCMAVAMAFTYAAPAAGVMFLSTLFVVFGFAALRSTPRQTMVLWTALATGLAVLFMLTDKPIGLPHDSYLERVASMAMFILTIGRCMLIGIVSSSMKQSLYENGLKLKEAYRRIEELAELDELTGSFNRRCIMRMLDEEIDRAARKTAPCSIALIDLDHFKRINDAHGHPTGDEVLRTFAITTFANIRSIDRFGRYGGEEFLLILPGMSEEDAGRALDRLRNIIADLDWSAFSPGMRVTISAGTATLRPNESPDNFLARADSALYAAKAQGRNRIACG